MKILILVLSIGLFVSCGGNWYVGEAGLPVPDTQPPSYRTQRGVTVYSTIEPSTEELRAIDNGIQDQLDRTVDRKWTRFRTFEEYRVLLLAPTYFSTSQGYEGCHLLTMHDGTTIIGTVIGYQLKNGVPQGNPIIVLPQQKNTPNCLELQRQGARHESEHIVLFNDPALFSYYNVNDFHPIFK